MDGETNGNSAIARPAIRVILALIGFACLVQIASLGAENGGLSWFLFLRQDIAALVLVVIMLILMRTASVYQEETRFHWLAVVPLPLIGAAGLVFLCWAGRYLILQDYDLSRDEQMAHFDAWILSRGQLFWQLPPEWQGTNAHALNLMFMLPIGDGEAWVSNYLPINAALHAFIGIVATPALTGPLLAGLGLLALWDVTRQIWPGRSDATLVAMLLYLLSAQIFFTAMTAYAMTGYLAFNLIWLALFLRNQPWSHGAAILIGFLATGLHQPLFHPLFIAPFLAVLLCRCEYRTLAIYLGAYAAIGLFWFVWPLWLSAHAVHPAPADAGGGIGFIERILHIATFPDISALWLLTLNILRFISWQHMLFLPLLIAGLCFAWRERNDLARALTIGLVIPLPLLLVLLPYQGHGWGYRYLHPVLGNAILLCVYGWFRLGGVRILASPMLIASAATLALVIPIHGWQVGQMIAPYAAVDRVIQASGARFAVINENAAPFASDLVINTPDLSNRPVRLLGGELSPSRREEVCSEHVIFIDAQALKPVSRYFGLAGTDAPEHRKVQLCP